MLEKIFSEDAAVTPLRCNTSTISCEGQCANWLWACSDIRGAVTYVVIYATTVVFVDAVKDILKHTFLVEIRQGRLWMCIRPCTLRSLCEMNSSQTNLLVLAHVRHDHPTHFFELPKLVKAVEWNGAQVWIRTVMVTIR